MSATHGRSWYVIQTHPHAEAKALEHLRRQGFETYLPRYQKQRRHARRVETVAVALFPRYLFVAFDAATERWHSIRSTLGVARLLGSESGPISISDAIVDDIRRRESDAALALQRPASFVRGERIRLVDGVFSICTGFFEGLAEKDRVAVLLDMLGRRVRVIVDRMAVAAV